MADRQNSNRSRDLGHQRSLSRATTNSAIQRSGLAPPPLVITPRHEQRPHFPDRGHPLLSPHLTRPTPLTHPEYFRNRFHYQPSHATSHECDDGYDGDESVSGDSVMESSSQHLHGYHTIDSSSREQPKGQYTQTYYDFHGNESAAGPSNSNSRTHFKDGYGRDDYDPKAQNTIDSRGCKSPVRESVAQSASQQGSGYDRDESVFGIQEQRTTSYFAYVEDGSESDANAGNYHEGWYGNISATRSRSAEGGAQINNGNRSDEFPTEKQSKSWRDRDDSEVEQRIAQAATYYEYKYYSDEMEGRGHSGKAGSGYRGSYKGKNSRSGAKYHSSHEDRNYRARLQHADHDGRYNSASERSGKPDIPKSHKQPRSSHIPYEKKHEPSETIPPIFLTREEIKQLADTRNLIESKNLLADGGNFDDLEEQLAEQIGPVSEILRGDSPILGFANAQYRRLLPNRHQSVQSLDARTLCEEDLYESDVTITGEDTQVQPRNPFLLNKNEPALLPKSELATLSVRSQGSSRKTQIVHAGEIAVNSLLVRPQLRKAKAPKEKKAEKKKSTFFSALRMKKKKEQSDKIANVVTPTTPAASAPPSSLPSIPRHKQPQLFRGNGFFPMVFMTVEPGTPSPSDR